jgi:hypothetical protein
MRSLHAPELLSVFITENIAVMRLEETWKHDVPGRINRPDLAEARLIPALPARQPTTMHGAVRHGGPMRASQAIHTTNVIDDALHAAAFVS